MSTNSVIGESLGHPIIEVNGLKIYYIHHSFQLDGVVFGSRVLNATGKAYCFEPKSQIACEITYNPHEAGFFSSIYSSGNHFIDEIQGSIFKTSP